MDNLFFSYAAGDETYRAQLEKHLSPLRRQRLIAAWHFRMITGGKEWKGEIDSHLMESQIILLLISPDFIDSDYCYDVEMKKAMDRHAQKLSRVIPVILRPTEWQASPFAKLEALPKDGKPIAKWKNRDEAYLNVVRGIKTVIQESASQKALVPIKAVVADVAAKPVDHRFYCSRCGQVPGRATECTGYYTSHNFETR
ncbi:MAG: TIR domain-containing protein [Dehalococcoidia bacterium]|nr:TIR domain-containing protein [Dehalococcoidia bacterium]